MLLDILDDAVELVERLRCLRIEIDVAREIEALDILEVGDDDGFALRLTDKTEHLSMTGLAEDDNLGVG